MAILKKQKKDGCLSALICLVTQVYGVVCDPDLHNFKWCATNDIHEPVGPLALPTGGVN